MTIFDDAKPRTGASQARKREREISRLMGKLIDTFDREQLEKSLKEDFGITAADPN